MDVVLGNGGIEGQLCMELGIPSIDTKCKNPMYCERDSLLPLVKKV